VKPEIDGSFKPCETCSSLGSLIPYNTCRNGSFLSQWLRSIDKERDRSSFVQYISLGGWAISTGGMGHFNRWVGLFQLVGWVISTGGMGHFNRRDGSFQVVGWDISTGGMGRFNWWDGSFQLKGRIISTGGMGNFN